MTRTAGEQAQQAQQPKERLIYSSVPWKIYEQDAGMGEHDYAVFLNDVFYCRTDDSQTAQRIVESIRSRPSPAPAQTCQTCYDEMAHFCIDCPRLDRKHELTVFEFTREAIKQHDAAIRAEAARQAREDEREKVLEDLRKLCMKDESVGCTVFRHIESLRGDRT